MLRTKQRFISLDVHVNSRVHQGRTAFTRSVPLASVVDVMTLGHPCESANATTSAESVAISTWSSWRRERCPIDPAKHGHPGDRAQHLARQPGGAAPGITATIRSRAASLIARLSGRDPIPASVSSSGLAISRLTTTGSDRCARSLLPPADLTGVQLLMGRNGGT